MNAGELQPERAWQMAVEQLRMEMTQAAFNTWVRDAQFVSFEDGLLTIGSANAHASQWLASRLTSTVERLLTGILNRSVTVQFVVHYPGYEQQAESEKEETAPRRAQPQKVLSLQAEYLSIYDQIVQPDQVIVFPGYFLRYIPMLGVELAWMYIGFRQVAYEAGAARKPGKKVSAAAKKVAQFSGMSTRTFWRWAAKSSTWAKLRWLVQPDSEGPRCPTLPSRA